MTEAKDLTATDAANLLTHYGFDLGGYAVEYLVDRWLRMYPAAWLRAAVVEALYQGRYKAFSVEQILTLWGRRGQPLQHFNHEFERIVCSKFPKNLHQELIWEPIANPQQAIALEPETVTEPKVFASVDVPDRSSATEADAAPEFLPALPPADPTPPDAASLTALDASPGASPEAIQPFQPNASSGLDTADLMIWSRGQASKHPIDQFVPAPAISDFYVRLKAVAQQDG